MDTALDNHLQIVEPHLLLHLRPGFSVDDDAEKMPIESFSALRDLLVSTPSQDRRFALLGDTGSGKTTILHWVASNVVDPDLLIIDDLEKQSPEVIQSLLQRIRQNRKQPVLVTCDRRTYMQYAVDLQRLDILPFDLGRMRVAIGDAEFSALRIDLLNPARSPGLLNRIAAMLKRTGRIPKDRYDLYCNSVGMTAKTLESERLLSEHRANRGSAGAFWPAKTWWEPTLYDDAALMHVGRAPEEVVPWLAEANPVLACHAATDFGIVLTRPILDRLRKKSVETMLHDPAIMGRAEIGRGLNLIGDPRPGVCDLHLDWREIPAGEFIYGADQETGEREMSLPRFYITRYLITYAQYNNFVWDNGYYEKAWWQDLHQHKSRPGNQGFKFDNHPRERVSWYEAVAFCRWLEAQRQAGKIPTPPDAPTDYVLRLPTEYEWEKAARGTDGRIYPHGGMFEPTLYNVAETGINQTCAVGMFPEGASPYGVLDMAGNVWEWTLNNFNTPDYVGLTGHVDRVLRGGSWRNGSGSARSTRRLRGYPAFQSDDGGFRVVFGPRLE